MVRFLPLATALWLLGAPVSNAADAGVCAIIAKPAAFDHQSVTLQGSVSALKETTSRRGNDYATFKLQDPSGCGAVTIFTCGHPSLSNGDQVRVEGVFETEHRQGNYTFYNEVKGPAPATRWPYNSAAQSIIHSQSGGTGLFLKTLLVAFIFVTASSVEALAWGYDAHRVVAEIAEQFLEPETARQVRALLAIENVATLAEVSTWADEIRSQRPETRPWHYVNIPVQPSAGTPDGYQAARDRPHDDCIVAKIEGFGRVLADRQAPER